MVGICGNEKASDALVSVDLNADGISLEIISKLKTMYGENIEAAVRESLKEVGVENAHVTVKDFGALDFVIKGRTKTAAKRAMKQGGEK